MVDLPACSGESKALVARPQFCPDSAALKALLFEAGATASKGTESVDYDNPTCYRHGPDQPK